MHGRRSSARIKDSYESKGNTRTENTEIPILAYSEWPPGTYEDNGRIRMTWDRLGLANREIELPNAIFLNSDKVSLVVRPHERQEIKQFFTSPSQISRSGVSATMELSDDSPIPVL